MKLNWYSAYTFAFATEFQIGATLSPYLIVPEWNRLMLSKNVIKNIIQSNFIIIIIKVF